jgi:hypothetical protein
MLEIIFNSFISLFSFSVAPLFFASLIFLSLIQILRSVFK